MSRMANVRQGVGGTVVGRGGGVEVIVSAGVEDIICGAGVVVGQMRISRLNVVEPGTRNFSTKLKV